MHSVQVAPLAIIRPRIHRLLVYVPSRSVVSREFEHNRARLWSLSRLINFSSWGSDANLNSAAGTLSTHPLEVLATTSVLMFTCPTSPTKHVVGMSSQVNTKR